MRVAWMLAAIGFGASVFSAPLWAQESELPDGVGKVQIQRACTACHSITQVTSQRRTKAEWADTVDQMVARGAQLSDAEYKMVIDYLGRNFAPASPAAPAAASKAK